MGVPAWVYSLLVPSIGLVVNNLMYVPPFLVLMEARKHKKLGKINPLPMATVTIAQVGWTIFSFCLRDYFIFFSSVFGMLLGFFNCFSAMHLLERPHHSKVEEDERVQVEMVILGGITLWTVVVFIICIVLGPNYSELSTTMVGAIAAATSIMYYATPLSHMVKIIRARNASSLHGPSIFCNLLNCILWFVYGLLALNIISCWLPNAIGVVLSVLELILVFVFPAKGKTEADGDDDDDIEGDASIKIHSSPHSSTSYTQTSSGNSSKLSAKSTQATIEESVELTKI